jgi:hypothetical protein
MIDMIDAGTARAPMRSNGTPSGGRRARPQRYQVIEMSADQTEVALLDCRGRCHIARRTSVLPAFGSELSGPGPSLGVATLCCVATHQNFRLDFVAIGCAHQQMLERFHPTVARWPDATD